jgi:hypothetical protein
MFHRDIQPKKQGVKKSLMIPKVLSETVNRRTDNAIVQ